MKMDFETVWTEEILIHCKVSLKSLKAERYNTNDLSENNRFTGYCSKFF